jgi:hypothetical protein
MYAVALVFRHDRQYRPKQSGLNRTVEAIPTLRLKKIIMFENAMMNIMVWMYGMKVWIYGMHAPVCMMHEIPLTHGSTVWGLF